MRIRNILSSLFTMFLVLILSIPPIQVYAESSIKEPQLKVEVVAGVVSNELEYNNRAVLGTSAWYTNNEGKKMPAYCIDPTAKGPGEVDAKKYTVNIAGANMDTYAAGCILEGYPYKSPAELGVSTIEEAYAATKAAIWCGIDNSPYRNINAWSADNPKVLEAMKGIIDRAKNHTDVTLALYSIKKITEPTDTGTHITQTFEPEANYPILDFVVELIGVYPEDTTVAKDGKTYTVSIPKSAVTTPGNVQVRVLLQMKSEVIMYGNPVDIADVQRLEVPMIPYEVIMESNTPFTTGDDSLLPGGEIVLTGKIKIVKTAYGTNQGLAGANFEVVDHLGGVLGVFTTGSDGTVTVQTNTTGAHGVTEIVPPIGYALDSINHKDVRVDKDRETVVNFSNKELPVIEILKVDANDSSKTLSGAVFSVALDGGHESFDVMTSSNGKAIVSEGLKPDATYKITEKVAPTNYQLNTEPQYIKTVAGEKQTVIFSNRHKPGLIVEKYDMDTAELLPDCEVSIRDKGGSIIWEGLTDEFGRVFIENLDVGEIGKWIEIHELAAPPGYIRTQEVKEVFLEAGMTEPVVVKLDNRKKPVIEILKIDKITKLPVKDTKYKVTYVESETVSEYLTDEYGKIVIKDMNEGIVRIEETIANDEYLLDAESKEIQLKAGDKKQLIFENTKKPTLVVTKINGLTNNPVPNTTYKIQYENPNGGIEDLGTYKTNAQGQIIIPKMSVGWYILTETIPAQGMQLPSNPVTRIYLGAGENTYALAGEGSTSNGENVGGNASEGNSTGGEGNNGNNQGNNQSNSNNQDNSNGGNDASGSNASNSTGNIKISFGNDYVIGEEIVNYPLNSIVIKKEDATTSELLAGAVFEVRKVSEDISGNSGTIIGRYKTDSSGIIVITGLSSGAYIIEEVQPPTNYLLSENSQQQAWLKADGTSIVEVVYSNYPYGSLLIVKEEEGNAAKKIAGVTFKVTDSKGAVVGTGNGEFVTDKNGQILISGLKPDSYVVTEIDAGKYHMLDATPQTIHIGTDGKTYKLTFVNKAKPNASILIHKIDSVTGKGIYGVTFLLYDGDNNPIGQYISDDKGYVHIDKKLNEGKYKLRELMPAYGYLADDIPRTIYVQKDKTTEITWKNTPEVGQIVITKRSSEFNELTGLPAGSPLEGAVFEVYNITGNLVDRIVSDARGIAATKGLQTGVYTFKEVSAPRYYALNDRTYIADIRHNGDIIRFEVLNSSISLNLTIQKKGPNEVSPGITINYEIYGVANDSSGVLENFYIHDRIPIDATRVTKITTGTYNERLYYKVTYKTNYRDYMMLAENLLTKNDYEFSLHPNVLGLQNGEYVTDVRLEFPKVGAGFKQTKSMYVFCQVLPTVPNGYRIINRADVGGRYGNEWESAKVSWNTTVRAVNTPSAALPRAGY